MREFAGMNFAGAVGDPAAQVQAAFDEEQAVRDWHHADTAQKSARLAKGRILLRALATWPKQWSGKAITYHPEFVRFFTRLGIARATAVGYMKYARNPEYMARSDRQGIAWGKRQIKTRIVEARKTLLTEMLELYNIGGADQLVAAIREELSNVEAA